MTDMTDITVRPVSSLADGNHDPTDDQIDLAAKILEETFKNDPFTPSISGGDPSLLPSLFKAFVAAAVVDGEAYFAELDGAVVGVACWHGPGKAFLASHEQREAGWNDFWNALSPSGQTWQTETYILRYNALYSRSLPTPTSRLDGYHLNLLGVLPAFQGKGIGTRLVREGQERAQQQGALMCLDTYTDTDVAIYKHWGFRVAGAESMSSMWSNFVMTIMVWEPKAIPSTMTGNEFEVKIK